MKAIQPKKNDSIYYLFLKDSGDNLLSYINPEGKICEAPSEYFTDIFDADDEKFSEDQRKVFPLLHLSLPFLKFFLELENKFDFWLFKHSVEENAVLSEEAGRRPWHVERLIINGLPHTVEVQKNASSEAIRSFIEKIREGHVPAWDTYKKTKKLFLQTELPQSDDKVTYKNLNIFAKVKY